KYRTLHCRHGLGPRPVEGAAPYLNARSICTTMKLKKLTCLCVVLGASAFPQRSANTKSVVVFKESGRFGGWPANNGIWSWGNEILVGFSIGYFKNNEGGHAIDSSKPSVLRFARSLDGGETWRIEQPPFLTADGKEPEPAESPGGFDFTHPDA